MILFHKTTVVTEYSSNCKKWWLKYVRFITYIIPINIINYKSYIKLGKNINDIKFAKDRLCA
jgi:hypothetical protein